MAISPAPAPSQPPAPRFEKVTALRLGLAWAMVTIFALGGDGWLAPPLAPTLGIACFMALFATIVIAAFGVVREAEGLARRLGEPYGTLVLTLSIVSIEVILIAAVMLGPGEFPTIGRDAVFAVMMIILNLVIGLCLLLGGLRHGEQTYNAGGASAYLAMTVLLGGVALALPNVTAAGNGAFAPGQAVAVALLFTLLYAAFLHLQMGRYRHLFVQPPAQGLGSTTEAPAAARSEAGGLAGRIALLLASLLPIVLLSHPLALLIDAGIAAAEAPAALGGVLIAIIVFTPESLTAIRAARADEIQRTVNLCLGAFVSTLGLTIPVVLFVGLATGKAVVMGLSPADLLLGGLTLALSALTFGGRRTGPLQGLMHLALFAVFGVLLVSP